MTRSLHSIKIICRFNLGRLNDLVGQAGWTTNIKTLQIDALYKKFREALIDDNGIPFDTRSFELTEHELSVIQSLGWLLNNEKEYFLNYVVATDDVEIVKEATLDMFYGYTCGNGLVLQWTLLLHDLAKGRSLSGPHPQQGAAIVGMLSPKIRSISPSLNEDDMKCIIWLIEYHDVLGNIYTGERRPAFLLKTLQFLPPEEQERRMKLLQTVTFCDYRGTLDGKYLTESKAQFWLGLSNIGRIKEIDKNLLNWRIERWTGDLFGVGNIARAEELRDIIKNSGKKELIKEIFGSGIDYIIYGFYLFTGLSTKQLATLMELISIALENYKCSEITLEFSNVYKPWESNANEILEEYKKQIDMRKLKYTIDVGISKIVVGF